MRISDWSSDVCSSDLVETGSEFDLLAAYARLSDLVVFQRPGEDGSSSLDRCIEAVLFESGRPIFLVPPESVTLAEHPGTIVVGWNDSPEAARSEEQPSETQSLMSISYAVLCLKKK